jgi:NAD(P)-dependent dehydrogenase (short-subunit alcohol dehydrogenase family)
MRAPVVLVTGASRGIGASIARAFAAGVPGARLALVARDARGLAATARACAAAGAAVEIFRCDVAEEAAVAAMADSVHRRFRRVDVLVNNAGVFAGAPFAELAVAEFDRIVAANLRSAFLVTRAFLPGMRRRGRGDVFFMSSIAGLGAYPNGAAYCAAKAGVTALARVLRAETKGSGLRVCCVHPGATWSPSWEGSGFAPGRMMPAADVARAFVDVWRMSPRTVVEEITLRPAAGDL